MKRHIFLYCLSSQCGCSNVSPPQSVIRCQAKQALPDVLAFVSEFQGASDPAFREIALRVFNSWISFELPVQESAPLVGISEIHYLPHAHMN